MQTRIYGSSDDLIEVEGKIEEEFDHYSNKPALLVFSDGTILTMSYGKNGMGIWQIMVIVEGDSFESFSIATTEKEHSDQVILNDVDWVIFSNEFTKINNYRG